MIAKDMGAVPAFVLRMPGSVRGDHPINSFAAVGPLAREIVRGVSSPSRVSSTGWPGPSGKTSG